MSKINAILDQGDRMVYMGIHPSMRFAENSDVFRPGAIVPVPESTLLALNRDYPGKFYNMTPTPLKLGILAAR